MLSNEVAFSSARPVSALSVVVLAAGEGTRMRSSLNKMLHPICGRPLVGHVLAVADALGAAQTIVVLSEQTLEPVRAALGTRYRYVVQAERLGTGHAVQQARALLAKQPGQVLVMVGDAPLMRADTARTLLDMQREQRAVAGLVSFRAEPPTGYGRVIRDEAGRVLQLVEERNATPEQRLITEVNSGVMCFDADWLGRNIGQLARNPVKGEYYLTDLVEMATAQRGPGAVVAYQVADATEAWGINDRVQLAEAEAELRRRMLADLMRAGVTIMDPTTTYIDVGVAIGADTTLLPGTLLRGATRVGANCEIGPHTLLVDAVVGDGARVRYAVVEQAAIAAGADVGPFAHVRGTSAAPTWIAKDTIADSTNV